MIPHFALPFRLLNDVSTGVAIVDQDSYDELVTCVELIVRTPVGYRDDAPTFGYPQQEFTQQPSMLPETIISQDPRVAVVIETQPDIIQAFLTNQTVKVQ